MRNDSLTAVLSAFPRSYTLLNRDGTPWKNGSTIDPLGEGGSSIVLRALYRNRLPRAVKVMIPRDDFVKSDSGVELFERSFENEKDRLSEITHERIARITDFADVRTDTHGSFPYVAMELVEGDDFGEWVKQEDVSGHDIIAALQQILDAVGHLHEHEVMHSDIKEENIIVSTAPSGVRACLVDLGVSHDVRVTPEDDLTYFFSTPDYVMPELRLVLSNKNHNRILKSDLRRHFPWQDLFSLGKIFKNTVAGREGRRKIQSAVGYGGVQALTKIGNSLTVPVDNRHHYRDVSEVKLAVSRISTASLAPLNEPLLSSTGSRGIVLPSLGRLVTPRYFDNVVSHPMFQRLHHLPQLDLLQYVFPGATHTRFPHALREMDLARQAINQQLHNWEFRIEVDQEDVVRTLLGALLNSVGRYHLHHMFEDYLPYRGRIPRAGLLNPSEVLAVLSGDSQGEDFGDVVRDSRGRSISDLLRVSLADIRRLRDEPSNPVQGFLAGLLDSPLDVNKLSYLRADSEATGVRFGLGLSTEAIFEYFTIAPEEDWEASPTGKRAVIGLKEDGISYAENAIMTRYWNIQTTYWNRTNRALQSMVKFVIGSLLATDRFDFPLYLRTTLHGSTSDALALLSRLFDESVGVGAIDKSAVNPLNEIRNSERNAYRRLLTLSPRSIVESREQDAEIYARVSTRSPLDDQYFCDVIAEVLSAVIPGVVPRPGEILLDVPRARREEGAGKVLVYSGPPEATLVGELSQASPVLKNLVQSFELYVKRLRVFVHPRIHAAVLSRSEDVHRRLLERLRSDVKAGLL